MSNIIGYVIGLAIKIILESVLIPTAFNSCYFLFGDIERGINRHTSPLWYKLIYPKWLSFRQFTKYNILRRKSFRHIQYEKKRLIMGMTILK